MSGHYYPPQGGGGSAYWGDAVATFASLPTGTVNGEVRLTLDTKNLYEWNGSAWVLILNSSGSVIGPASAVDSQFALFDGTTGKLIKAATGTGVVHATSGVYSVSNVLLTSEVTGVLPIANGGTNSGTALNSNRFMVSVAGAIVEAAAVTASRALVSDANGLPTASTVTTTTLAFLDATSSVQTQLNARVLSTRNINTTAPLTGGGDLSADRTIAMPAATSLVDGYLLATDWVIFNSKQAAGNYITALTGDVTASGPGSVAATIANLAVTNAKIANATIDLTTKVTGVLPVANGGTNSSTALSNNRVMKSSGGAVVEAAAITASRALASDANGIPVAATTTTTELNFLSGVTSAVQTQLDAKLCATTTVNVSSNVTLTDKAIHYVDTSSARSLTLPSPTAARFIVIKDSTGSCQTNNITIVRAGSEKIETVSASYVMDANLQSLTLTSDGTDWFAS